MIKNNDISPSHDFIPAQGAQRVLMYVEQDDSGKVSFQPANMVYHDPMITKPTPKEVIGVKESIQNLLKWIGLSLPIVASIVGASYWINSTIESKSNQNRLEMKSDLSAVKQDIMVQTLRTQDAVQRLSDRTDEKFDKVNSGMNDIKTLIISDRK